MKLQGLVAVVTGGSQGIGKAVVEALLAKQAKVCIADVLEADGNKAVEELGLQYGSDSVCFVRCDVTSDQDFENVMTTVKSKFGNLDVLVNNAGIGRTDMKDWSKIIDVNLKGVMRGTILAYDHLADRQGNKGGMVINIGSIAGLMAIPTGSPYCASKWGIVGWSKSAGHKWNAAQTGVKVNVICPKTVDTEMAKAAFEQSSSNQETSTHLKSLANANMIKPSQVAEAVLKVLEDDVTGAVLVVAFDKTFYFVDDDKKF